ncbi:MAG: hypothetical protein HY843_05285 [Bdellovibrio sp.]|nr:hypothetical protein [Bdellovibrio sp.]
MTNRGESNLNFITLLLLALLFGILCGREEYSSNIELLRLNNNVGAIIKISPNGLVLINTISPKKGQLK